MRTHTALTRVMQAWCAKAEVARAAALATPPAASPAPALPPLTGKEIRARLIAALPPVSTPMEVVQDHDGRLISRPSRNPY